MTPKLTFQIKEKIQNKIIHRRKSNLRVSNTNPADTETLLNDLVAQLNNNQEEYTHAINVLRAKFVQDSETIKMGLAKLLTSQQHRDEISADKLNRLKELLAIDRQNGSKPDCGDIKSLHRHEKHLAEVEKEVIEILSKRFKK